MKWKEVDYFLKKKDCLEGFQVVCTQNLRKSAPSKAFTLFAFLHYEIQVLVI